MARVQDVSEDQRRLRAIHVHSQRQALAQRLARGVKHVFSTTRPKNDLSRESLATEIERCVAAHPELASGFEVRLVDDRYVVVLDNDLRTRLGAALTENVPSLNESS